ncbi:kynureninase [Tunicatimonas pelagia]|uniref:kynureninase n=1 Tax=Tunicatimonas pelagia TaxID=931531 RepID=UPI00266702F3|nr:kynureninase [Tunicatimonas pelagia]WKN44593.1 kynureninase [Tunicatimonas pelagia]
MEELEQQASKYDQADELKHFRQKYHIPADEQGREKIYFCGNSLGLQPKAVAAAVEKELENWRTKGVEGHFAEPKPWWTYHKQLKSTLAHIVGAKEHEVVAMNNLTTNLHLLMASFYQPTSSRYKIMIEGGAFPSDHYAVESQLRWHGFDPVQALVELQPRPNEEILRTADILQAIGQHADSLALVLLPGIQYYTGQFFDLKRITEVAQEAGANVGFDLAHAVGNVPMQLHHWNVDFAVWCSYKYLNSGPGNTGGAFVHERYADNAELPRLAGWWGHQEEDRFQMKPGFKPMYGVDGWQLSNANILPLAAQSVSLEIVAEAGVDRVRQKSLKLTGFLEECIHSIDPEGKYVTIITPSNPDERGAQLSLVFASGGRQFFEKLTQSGIIVDWREPSVIRVAPAPLYNTFTEVYHFSKILSEM